MEILLHLDLVVVALQVERPGLAVLKEMMVVMVTLQSQVVEMELPVEVVVLDKQDLLLWILIQEMVLVDMVDMVFRHHLHLEIQHLQ
tara:strand:+ start:62 stop:322 length:261 start_codon:yes stop_codon:yes gene_type:complete